MPVFKSGSQYLIAHGTGEDSEGRLVDVESGSVSPLLLVGSILAHAHVVEPWQEIPESEWPELVRRIEREGAIQ